MAPLQQSGFLSIFFSASADSGCSVVNNKGGDVRIAGFSRFEPDGLLVHVIAALNNLSDSAT